MEEYPVVADINNDGQAEICFSCLADDAIDATDNDLETVNTPLGHIRVHMAPQVDLVATNPWNMESACLS